MSTEHTHVVLIGFGNMGRALARGWCESIHTLRITVVDPSPEARSTAIEMGLAALASPGEVDARIDVAVLAVKPNQIESALSDLPGADLYLSIAAGRSLDDIVRASGHEAAVVRCMPNTPAAIGLGISALCANAKASAAHRRWATELMASVGLVEWIDDEKDMDAVTAVSGSGPAYVFLLIECLTAAAIDVGLNPGLAARLALATVNGAGSYAATSGVDARELRRQVTSPNGTTAAALEVLCDRHALLELITKAVRAARDRSRELRAAD